jgi:MSHA pilin protein MshC
MDRRGFTLVELIMVIVLLGILAVIAVPKLGDITGMKASAFADKLRADLRYAQNVAMRGNDRVRVYFNNVGARGVTAPLYGYAVGFDSSAAQNCTTFTAVQDPSGTGNLNVNVASLDNSFRVTPSGGITCIEFDTLGRPYNCTGDPGNCIAAALAADTTVTITPSGNITITAQTGAVN